MNKLFTLTCFYGGAWGVLGFLVTIALGFVFCCAGWSQTLYISLLALFSLVGIVMTWKSVSKCCEKFRDVPEQR
ncbi:hypothetical protein [Mangrovibacterium lignilyticum]|uniref:hypothetical protein n=1 Tax=Mangrovibacterium lignilyticum TaxID=2668052 RepID=UPI0013D1CE96|nr:hypothetical protein [Mangrovibacterium lignilyticum]